ncbi:TetR/AcrR family transcriptional regulator [Pseudonocardia kujensis]|uniref:TetR/AcrR family transcriptional regulator n=1 Tax=Pseudonocardia kujensis TaxID=1128675 RepID=UPI001E507A73|nr:TetR/AcrR family transcriptional regulator [Pseudonocardia kujensis]MCE0764371.1 TetR/AcrR family transcriptional regulator [Pseudonocardia kujensis]
MTVEGQGAGSPRREELLEAAYAYVLRRGLADLSLRPLAKEIGSSPRVLLYLFGSKDGLVRALLGRARAAELTLLAGLPAGDAAGLLRALWEWLAAPAHRDLLRLWVEGYGRALVEPDGPWAGFAAATVRDWLAVLGRVLPEPAATEALAVLRGALLDLLATGDAHRTGAAVAAHAARLA